MAHIVTLLKPTAEQKTRKWDAKKKEYTGENFDHGERIILVDGVRWGRTIVTRHGCHGTKHQFVQHGGEVLLKEKNNRWSEYEIRSQKRQRWLEREGDPKRKTTEERVLEMAQMLVADGMLRHPDIVAKEQERAREVFAQAANERGLKRAADFRAKAIEALESVTGSNTGVELAIERVIAAMEWAVAND